MGMKSVRTALLGLAAAAACVLTGGQAAQADFLFSPTGTGPAGAQFATAFDPAPGNALAAGGNQAIANGVGSTFQLYYQATMSSVIGQNGLPNNTGTYAGMNTAYQITVLASVTEQVTSVGANSATFEVAPNQSANSFLRIYQNNGAPVADNLTGTGFSAGNLILSATPISSPQGSGSFTVLPGQIQAFDQFKANDYPNTQSVVSTGSGNSSTIDFLVTSTDPSYFVTPPPTVIGLRFITSASVPFISLDPSRTFNDGPGALPGGPVVPVLGPVNGAPFTVAAGNKDFQFVADSFVTPVPEPSSLALTGIGLAGALAFVRRKRASVA